MGEEKTGKGRDGNGEGGREGVRTKGEGKKGTEKYQCVYKPLTPDQEAGGLGKPPTFLDYLEHNNCLQYLT